MKLNENILRIRSGKEGEVPIEQTLEINRAYKSIYKFFKSSENVSSFSHAV